MTCAVPSFCGYIRCPDANFCREETIWSCFIHCFSFLIIFFNIHAVRTLCYFALERNATVHSRPATQQLNNSKQTHLESSCPKLSNGICLQNFPRVGGGGGGIHLLAHGLLLHVQCSSQSAPLRESRKRSTDGPHQKRSRAIMALFCFNSMGLKMSLLLQLQ